MNSKIFEFNKRFGYGKGPGYGTERFRRHIHRRKLRESRIYDLRVFLFFYFEIPVFYTIRKFRGPLTKSTPPSLNFVTDGQRDRQGGSTR